MEWTHTHTHTRRLLYGQIRRRYNNIVVVSHTHADGRARATMTSTKIISAEHRPVFAAWESICACGRYGLCARLWPMSNRTQCPTTNTAQHCITRYTYYGRFYRRSSGNEWPTGVRVSRTVRTDFSIWHVRFAPRTQGRGERHPGPGVMLWGSLLFLTEYHRLYRVTVRSWPSRYMLMVRNRSKI